MDEFTKDELANGLSTHTLGRHAVLLDTVDSTNASARRLAGAGNADGVVVIAETQSAGRGRRGRHWVSESGCGLWMSFVTEPFMALEEIQKLTLAAGLAVCRAAERCAPGMPRPVIKWPNDVLAGGRKLCGILCESAADTAGKRYVIAGIGVNTKIPQGGWGEAAGLAVSLDEACGRPVSRLWLASQILNEMERLMDQWRADGFASIAAGYRDYMVPIGTRVAIADGDNTRRGRIEGLDDGGGLAVRLDSGELERIISGEISVSGG